MSEGGGGGGVSQVVSWHVDGLDRGDGALLGGGDPLLHATHVSGQGWLVTHSRGDTTQQSRHFRTSLIRRNILQIKSMDKLVFTWVNLKMLSMKSSTS